VAVNGFYTVIADRIEFVAAGNEMTAANLTTSHSWGFELASYLSIASSIRSAGCSYESTTSQVPARRPWWWNRLYAPNGPVALNHWTSATDGSRPFGFTFPRYHI